MLYLKKCFTEGLIQMAILLSLCGVKVDVGLEPFLPSSLNEAFTGPTSALPSTQFHNLYNRLHPKNVDLDGFFTVRRLLGWARSFDRLQVPPAEVETWLVQQEPDPSPVRRLEQPPLRDRYPVGIGGDRAVLPLELQVRLVNQEEDSSQEVVHHSGSLFDQGEEDLARDAEERGAPEGSTGHVDRALTVNRADQTSASLQECLRLLEETFTFTEVQQLEEACDGRESLECQPPDGEHLPCPRIPAGTTSVDMELQWQDLLAIMEPENTNSDMTSFDHTLKSGPAETSGGSEAVLQNCGTLENPVTETHLASPFFLQHPQHGLLEDQSICQGVPVLLPLTPSAELDNHSSAQGTEASLNNPDVDCSPPDHTELLAETPLEQFSMGHHAENDSFNINLLTHDVSGMEPQTPPLFDADFYPCSQMPSRSVPSLLGNGGTQDYLPFSSHVFLVDSGDAEDERDLISPIGGLLENATMLEEIRLLDLALEEGFCPEMADGSSEKGNFGHEMEKSEREEDHVGFSPENRSQTGRHQQDDEDEADSDSGLSLEFSHSPASPCVSETSFYSPSSLSNSSSSCVSTVGTLTENEETNLFGFDVEMEVDIKQEDPGEDVGAVGGGYPGDAEELLSFHDEDQKVFEGFPWLQHVGHNHTYNQHWSSILSPVRKSHIKHTKSASAQHNAKPYFRSLSSHLSKSKLLSRDEQRARYLKIPLSNELIVNLPVEEFNDLLTKYHFNEEQLNLIRDIRRRGKNKLAAQNCRKRKLDVLLGLEDNVSSLRRYRSQLLREKREALSNLQEMKRQLGLLYQEVFSRLRDETGRPLDAEEYLLQFGTNGHILVAPTQQEAEVPQRGEKPNKKPKYKKK